MPTYNVKWEMDFDADNPLDAARQAMGTLQDPGNTATWFRVTNDKTGESVLIDAEDGTVARQGVLGQMAVNPEKGDE